MSASDPQADLARVRLLLEQPAAQGDRRRPHWARELVVLETLARALRSLRERDLADSEGERTLRDAIERLGAAVAGARGKTPSEPKAAARADGPPERAAPPPRGEAPRRPAHDRRAVREAALETYPLFLAEEQERSAAAAVARAAREGGEPHEVGALPLLAAREELVTKLQAHDVLLLVGETGSGKSLLSPLFALESGLGHEAMICQTQPRRVAARQIAGRLAEMTATEPGELIGCHTRIDRTIDRRTAVKVCTDGILLQELRGDPLLRRYDLVILDEAHERSTNIDLLLGLLRRLRERRPELKLLVTSATLEQKRFMEFFELGPEQLVEVPGRLYPVEIEYRDEDEDDDPDRELDLDEVIAREVARVCQDGLPGDVLVFLPRAREIAACHKALDRRKLRGVTVLTMHGSQDPEDNARCLQPLAGRKVVLATNIAETSLTIPGVRTVIDSGLVNQTDFDPKTGITSLRPRPISQASAAQRAGRAGRLAEGRCIRLWPEDDHARRPEHTVPEIMRSDLAALTLRMAHLGIEEIPKFPFVTRPKSAQLGEARRALIELGALERGGPITELGRKMAALPLEPRIARLLLAAEEEDTVEDALTIAAAMSVSRSLFRQPRPEDPEADKKRAAIKRIKQKLAAGGSDFDCILALVDGYRARRWKERKPWLVEVQASPRALQEIADIRADLVDALRGVRLGVGKGRGRRRGKDGKGDKPDGGERHARPPKQRPTPKPSDRDRLGRTLLAGLLGQVGVLMGRVEYNTPAGESVYMHPGSVLFDRNPKPALIACGQLMKGEARTLARHLLAVKIEWLQRVCPQLLSYLHRDVHFDPERGQVRAVEEVFFHKLTISEGREIDLFGRDPERAMRVLIQEGLLQNKLGLGTEFHQRNVAVIDEVARLASRLGDPSLAPEEPKVLEFYARKLAGCTNGPAVVKRVKGDPERHLAMSLADFLSDDQLTRARTWFPKSVTLGGAEREVSYVYNPYTERRSATIRVPADEASALSLDAISHAIPGLVDAQLEAWCDAAQAAGLLDADRREALLQRFDPTAGSPLAAISRETGELPDAVREQAREAIAESQLTPILELTDAKGKVVGKATDRAQLTQLLRRGVLDEAWAAARDQFESLPITTVARVPELFVPQEGRPLLEQIRVWGDPDTGEEQVATLGLLHQGERWSRHLYRSRREALEGTRAAIAAFHRLKLRLDSRLQQSLGCRLDPALEKRAYELTGSTTLHDQLRRWLESVACGRFIDEPTIASGQLEAAVKKARKRAQALASALPARLTRALERLRTLRRKARKDEASPEQQALLDRAVEQLRSWEDHPPELHEALLAELG